MQRIVGMIGGWAIAAPVIVFAAPATFGDLVHMAISYINFIIPIVISLAVLLYVRNTASGLFNMQKGAPSDEWKSGVLWGILAIFLMVSIWGILSIIANTFQIPVGR